MKTKNAILPVLTVLVMIFISGCQKWEPLPAIQGRGPVVSEHRQAVNFTGIQVDVNADVRIVQSPQTFIMVVGQQNILDILETRTLNNVLEIRYACPVGRHKRLEIEIAVPDLTLISSFGGSNITTHSPIYTQDISLDIFGSGNISIQGLTTARVRSRIFGSGNVYLMGHVQQQQVTINGSGNYNADGLWAENTVVNIFGSGNSYVHAARSLDIAVHGSGSVFYSGNPSFYSSNIFGSGKIVRVN